MSKEMNFRKIFIDMPAANVPVRISTIDDIFVNDFEVFVPAGNTGSVYLGDSDVEGSAGTDGGHIPRSKGSLTNFTASENQSVSTGDYFNLKNLYVVADNAGDDVIIMYKVGK